MASHLHSRPDRRTLRGKHNHHRRRKIAVHAVPAKTYPADSASFDSAQDGLRAAAVPFFADALRDLIARGVLIELDGKIVRGEGEE